MIIMLLAPLQMPQEAIAQRSSVLLTLSCTQNTSRNWSCQIFCGLLLSRQHGSIAGTTIATQSYARCLDVWWKYDQSPCHSVEENVLKSMPSFLCSPFHSFFPRCPKPTDWTKFVWGVCHSHPTPWVWNWILHVTYPTMHTLHNTNPEWLPQFYTIQLNWTHKYYHENSSLFIIPFAISSSWKGDPSASYYMVLNQII